MRRFTCSRRVILDMGHLILQNKTPHDIESAAASDVTRLEYTDCADESAVTLYGIKGGGHTWPGGKSMPEWLVGPTSRSIDATSLMWAFLREHPLREAPTAARHQ